MLKFVAISTGLLIRGAGWANSASDGLPWRADWSVCLDWSEAECRCWESELVVEWPCGVPLHLRVLGLAESECDPMRAETVYWLPSWDPCDIDLDGFVTRRDIWKWVEKPYDWNRDGVINDLPLILLRMEQGC